MKKVLIGGAFDLTHAAHITVLKRAKAKGDFLIVNLMSDERIRDKKGNTRPILPLKDRMTVVKELKCVDKVISIPGKEYPFYKAIEKSKPDIVIADISEHSDLSKEKEYCKKHKVKLVVIKRIIADSGLDTTKIIQKIIKQNHGK
jgi:cytidyltransferase-like protein